MWIARDKDGSLYLYENKPLIVTGNDYFSSALGDCYSINSKHYPEITFYNSPKRLTIL